METLRIIFSEETWNTGNKRMRLVKRFGPDSWLCDQLADLSVCLARLWVTEERSSVEYSVHDDLCYQTIHEENREKNRAAKHDDACVRLEVSWIQVRAKKELCRDRLLLLIASYFHHFHFSQIGGKKKRKKRVKSLSVCVNVCVYMFQLQGIYPVHWFFIIS